MTKRKSVIKVRVSLGLLVDLKVDGKDGIGDRLTNPGEAVQVEVMVSGPSWTQVDRVLLYANGEVLHDSRVDDPGQAGEKARMTWEMPRPDKDTFLVVIATGPGLTEAFWPIPRPCQPSSPVFEPRVIGSTNPVWIDVEEDPWRNARESRHSLSRVSMCGRMTFRLRSQLTPMRS